MCLACMTGCLCFNTSANTCCLPLLKCIYSHCVLQYNFCLQPYSVNTSPSIHHMDEPQKGQNRCRFVELSGKSSDQWFLINWVEWLSPRLLTMLFQCSNLIGLMVISHKLEFGVNLLFTETLIQTLLSDSTMTSSRERHLTLKESSSGGTPFISASMTSQRTILHFSLPTTNRSKIVMVDFWRVGIKGN